MDPKDQVTPPDMASAGMMQPPPPLTNPFTGISAMPSQPIQLPQVPQAPMPMMNPYAAAGVGGLNPGGPNPLLQYQNQIQDNLRQEQWQKQQMQLRLMEMETKKQEAALKIGNEMLAHPDPAVKKAGAGVLRTYTKSINLNIPDSVFEAMGTGRLSPADNNGILKLMAIGYTPEMIAKQYPAATPQDMLDIGQTWMKVRGNPRALTALGLETEEKIKRDALDLEIKEAQKIELQHPEWKGNANTVEAAVAIARTKFKGEYLKLPKDQQDAVWAEASALVKADEERKMRLQNQLSFDRAVALAGIRAANAADKPLTPMQKQKLLEGPRKARDTLAAMDRLDTMIDKMDAMGALPKGESYAAQKWAQAKRETLMRGSDDVFKFKQAWSPISVGQIDRGLFDEKNVRFKQAFEQQTGVVDNMPPAKAMKDYLKTMRELIQKKADNDISEWEDLSYPKDVIEVSRRMMHPAGATPAAPQEQPADLTYNRKTKQWGKP